MQGGAGDDAYTVVGNADTVIEASNEGIDSITLIGDANRGWNFSLPANVENLMATSATWVFPGQNRNFFGNTLNNVIKGDPEWFNFIDGGLGADTMIGGTFQDTYIVDDAGDTVSDSRVCDRYGPELRQLHARPQSREPDPDRDGGDQRHGQRIEQCPEGEQRGERA